MKARNVYSRVSVVADIEDLEDSGQALSQPLTLARPTTSRPSCRVAVGAGLTPPATP
jgi:hypothetical protein